MKRFTAWLTALTSALAFSLTASAEQPPPDTGPKGIATESVIVTAPALRTEKALDNFIISHAAPTPALGKIARWKTGICPFAIGLSPRFNLYVSQRIIRVAMLAGAPLDKGETCRPNILVIATDQPQALLDFVRAKRPALLGFHYQSQAEKLATMKRAVQAWYSTATEDFWGFISADLPSWDLGCGVMSASTLGQPVGVHASGSRLGDGLKSQLTTAIILVDTRKIAGQEIGPLADYIAMLALSQGQSYDTCQNVPTITNLLASGCADHMKPTALTDIDATYLRGLYKMDAGGSYIGERASIAFAMKKELGGY